MSSSTENNSFRCCPSTLLLFSPPDLPPPTLKFITLHSKLSAVFNALHIYEMLLSFGFFFYYNFKISCGVGNSVAQHIRYGLNLKWASNRLFLSSVLFLPLSLTLGPLLHHALSRIRLIRLYYYNNFKQRKYEHRSYMYIWIFIRIRWILIWFVRRVSYFFLIPQSSTDLSRSMSIHNVIYNVI